MQRTLMYAVALIGLVGCNDPVRPNGAAHPAGAAETGATNAGALRIKDVVGVQDLGTLGGENAGADDINERGQVTGGAGTVSQPFGHAYRWSHGGGMRDLGHLGGDISGGVGLNDRGDVAGVSRRTDDNDHAFLWTEQRGMQDLGTLGGQNSYGSAVNNRRQVAGDSPLSIADGGRRRPFLWTARRGMRNLGTLGGPGSDVWGTDINDRTHVVGIVFLDGVDADPPSTTRAYRWTPENGMQDLGTLGGTDASAWSINERGDVAGGSVDEEGEFQAFLWSPGVGMRGLGTLGGGFAVGYSLNQRRVVVGESLNEDFTFLPFVWSKETGMRALPIAEVGGVEGVARGINDRNEISGFVFTATGTVRAVLWRERRNRDLLTSIVGTTGEFEVAAVGAPAAAPRVMEANRCTQRRMFAARGSRDCRAAGSRR